MAINIVRFFKDLRKKHKIEEVKEEGYDPVKDINSYRLVGHALKELPFEGKDRLFADQMADVFLSADKVAKSDEKLEFTIEDKDKARLRELLSYTDEAGKKVSYIAEDADITSGAVVVDALSKYADRQAINLRITDGAFRQTVEELEKARKDLERVSLSDKERAARERELIEDFNNRYGKDVTTLAALQLEARNLISYTKKNGKTQTYQKANKGLKVTIISILSAAMLIGGAHAIAHEIVHNDPPTSDVGAPGQQDDQQGDQQVQQTPVQAFLKSLNEEVRQAIEGAEKGTIDMSRVSSIKNWLIKNGYVYDNYAENPTWVHHSQKTPSKAETEMGEVSDILENDPNYTEGTDISDYISGKFETLEGLQDIQNRYQAIETTIDGELNEITNPETGVVYDLDDFATLTEAIDFLDGYYDSLVADNSSLKAELESAKISLNGKKAELKEIINTAKEYGYESSEDINDWMEDQLAGKAQVENQVSQIANFINGQFAIINSATGTNYSADQFEDFDDALDVIESYYETLRNQAPSVETPTTPDNGDQDNTSSPDNGNNGAPVTDGSTNDDTAVPGQSDKKPSLEDDGWGLGN